MRRLILTLAALAAVSAGLLVAVPQQAQAHQRYPICVQPSAGVGAFTKEATRRAAVSWDTRSTYWVYRNGATTKCPSRTAITILVTTVRWGRNGYLGRSEMWPYYRSDQHAYFCRVRVNVSYPNSVSTGYQGTIAHEIGHCLTMRRHYGYHSNGDTIMNVRRTNPYPSWWDHRQVNYYWGNYHGYGR